MNKPLYVGNEIKSNKTLNTSQHHIVSKFIGVIGPQRSKRMELWKLTDSRQPTASGCCDGSGIEAPGRTATVLSAAGVTHQMFPVPKNEMKASYSSPIILKVRLFNVAKEGVEHSKVLFTSINTTVNPKIWAVTVACINMA